MSSLSPRRLYVLLVGLAVACALAHATSFDLVVEDAYITYRYAENAAHGLGLVFNPGEHVEGFTSLGWTLLLELVARMGAPVPAVSRLLSTIAGLGVVVITAELSVLWRGGVRDARAALPAFVVAAFSPLAYWSTSGMEGCAFAFAVAVGAWVTTRATTSETWKTAALAGLALGLATIVRPEGFGYACALGLPMIVARERRWARCGAYVTAYALVVGPETIWRWTTFHHLLPNTYYAKASFSVSLLGRGARQLESFLTMHLGWLALAALAWLASKKRGAWLVPAVVVLAAMANLVIVGGDAFHLFRFLLPALPAMAVALVAGAEAAAERLPSARRDLVVVSSVVAFGAWLVLASFLPTRTIAWRDAASPRARLREIEALDDDYFLVGEWLRRSMPPGTWIAVNAAGIVPYVSRLPAIDMLGLVDEHVAHLAIPLGSGDVGHEKHDGAYVLSRRPAVIILDWPALLRPRDGAELDAWLASWRPFLPGDREIFDDPGFQRDYQRVCVPIPKHGFLQMFVRRDAFPHSP